VTWRASIRPVSYFGLDRPVALWTSGFRRITSLCPQGFLFRGSHAADSSGLALAAIIFELEFALPEITSFRSQ
jgi:hypothetical protein